MLTWPILPSSIVEDNPDVQQECNRARVFDRFAFLQIALLVPFEFRCWSERSEFSLCCCCSSMPRTISATKEIYSPHRPTVERVSHILNERKSNETFFSSRRSTHAAASIRSNTAWRRRSSRRTRCSSCTNVVWNRAVSTRN